MLKQDINIGKESDGYGNLLSQERLKMKRKIFPLLLLTVFTLCLSSCHGKTTDTEAAKEQDSSAKNEETGTGGDTKQESEQKDCLLYYETGDNSVGSMYLMKN